jgi:NAD(P)H-hydrate epimerase
MKIVNTEQMRELDRRTIAESDVTGEVLMDRAGQGVAEVVEYLVRMSGYPDAEVLLFAGRGNNGGDVFAAARYLHEWGLWAEVYLAGSLATVKGDALAHLERMRAAGVDVHELPGKEDWESVKIPPSDGMIVVDGLLGTGVSGAPREPVAEAIRRVNELGERQLVVAVDIPSGLDSDTGAAPGEVVSADVTATMGLPKPGLVEPEAVDHVGNLQVVDIGIPPQLVAGTSRDTELITVEDVRRLFVRRARRSHKGIYGHLLIIGGSPGFSGAVVMAARAAVRSGAGLVSALVPASIMPTVAGGVPEAMIHGGRETRAGTLAADCVARWNRSLDEFDAVLVGPGMATRKPGRILVERLLAESPCPLVLDADALNVCVGKVAEIRRAAGPVVLTPHPGELARLLGCGAADIQADRFRWARAAVGDTNAVVVLKGAGTLVAAPDVPLQVNLTGNPGMATGGTGDVLAGILGGFVAQGFRPFDAACAAVYIHGRAGDNVAWRTSQASLTAGDLIEELASVCREVTAR